MASSLQTRRRSRWLTLLSAALVCSGCAADDSNGVAANEPPASANIGFQLLTLHSQYEKFVAAGNDPAQFAVDERKARIVDGRVLVELVATENAEDLAAEIRNLSATNVAVAGRQVSCFMPLERIGELSTLPGLHSARLSVAATRARKVQENLTE